MFVSVPLARVTSSIGGDTLNQSSDSTNTNPSPDQSQSTSLPEIDQTAANKFLRRRSVFVENFPPKDTRICTLVTINEDNVAGVIQNLRQEGSVLLGDFAPKNQKVCNLFSTGQVSFGLRAFRDGSDKLVPVTWDLISPNPHPNEA